MKGIDSWHLIDLSLLSTDPKCLHTGESAIQNTLKLGQAGIQVSSSSLALRPLRQNNRSTFFGLLRPAERRWGKESGSYFICLLISAQKKGKQVNMIRLPPRHADTYNRISKADPPSTTEEDSCDGAKKVACVDSQTSVSPGGVTAFKPVVNQILSSSSK